MARRSAGSLPAIVDACVSSNLWMFVGLMLRIGQSFDVQHERQFSGLPETCPLDAWVGLTATSDTTDGR
jgi:hypothetical protein